MILITKIERKLQPTAKICQTIEQTSKSKQTNEINKYYSESFFSIDRSFYLKVFQQPTRITGVVII